MCIYVYVFVIIYVTEHSFRNMTATNNKNKKEQFFNPII